MHSRTPAAATAYSQPAQSKAATLTLGSDALASAVEKSDESERAGEVALVFGRERTGLENHELQLCHAAIVARELALPAVLNVAGAASVLDGLFGVMTQKDLAAIVARPVQELVLRLGTERHGHVHASRRQARGRGDSSPGGRT